MTSLRYSHVTCALCGAVSSTDERLCTDSFGTPELDFRPTGMARFTLALEVTRCPSCQYCYSALDVKPPPSARETVASVRYQSAVVNEAWPETARLMYCWALIEAAAGQWENAAQRAVCAAWACDDDDVEDASMFRLEAVEFLSRVPPVHARSTERRQLLECVKVDLLRRAGEFGRAASAASAFNMTFGDDPWARTSVALMRFQLELTSRCERSAHSVRDAQAVHPM